MEILYNNPTENHKGCQRGENNKKKVETRKSDEPAEMSPRAFKKGVYDIDSRN